MRMTPISNKKDHSQNMDGPASFNRFMLVDGAAPTESDLTIEYFQNVPTVGSQSKASQQQPSSQMSKSPLKKNSKT